MVTGKRWGKIVKTAHRKSIPITPMTGYGEVMKLHMLLVLGLTVGFAGCAEKEQPAPEEAGTVDADVPAVTEDAAVEPAEMTADVPEWRTSAFMDHMHAHAEHLDDLNFALDDGDLEAAMMPAYWLSRHKTVGGLPDELQPYLVGMREAARAVEEAQDLEAARAAAQKIAKQCQACHAAVGVATE